MENGLTFGEVTGKSLVSCFLTHGVVVICTVCTMNRVFSAASLLIVLVLSVVIGVVIILCGVFYMKRYSTQRQCSRLSFNASRSATKSVVIIASSCPNCFIIIIIIIIIFIYHTRTEHKIQTLNSVK